MDLKKLKLAIEQAQKVCNEMNKCANKFILQDSINMLNEAITVTPCCTELVCDHPEDERTWMRSGKAGYCNKCDEMIKAN